jgi:4-hydroxybenzoate polyprenyltransferase/phosphoserine phosphatase
MTQTNEFVAHSATRTASCSPALCVDLDGTLVKSDTLVDALFALFRRRPVTVLRCSRLLLHGKAAFKAGMARHVILNPATLPYNQPLLDHLRAEHAAGRDIYLVTAANEEQARGIADHLGIFKAVFASGRDLNLSADAKREVLERRFPECGFDYIGNARPDVPVLRQAQRAMLANPSLGLHARLKRHQITVHRVFEDRAPRLKTLLSAMRVKQWSKNLLVFLPLLLAHSVLNRQKFLETSAAFVSWSLAASATYIFNDLLDMEADRNHPWKRGRPFAAGDLSPQSGVAVVCVLVVLAAMLAMRLPISFSFWLGSYFVTTIAYSLVLKKFALVDVLTLAGLYTVRMVAGGAASDVALSPWLGGFSIFFFLSLAIVKRYAELDNLRKAGQISADGRGYHVEDIEQLRSFGTASGYASVVVFTLYINNPEVIKLYGHSQRLWLLAPVLIFWISRIWLLAHRGKLDEDPVVFALTDYWSAALGIIALLIVLSAV